MNRKAQWQRSRIAHPRLHLSLVVVIVTLSLLAAPGRPSVAIESPAPSVALPVSDEISRYALNCAQGWRTAYRIDAETGCVLRVTLRVRLVPQPGVGSAELEAAKVRWERAVRETWSGRFPILAQEGVYGRCDRFRLEVQVQWVEQGEHYAVQVLPGEGQCDLNNWYVGDPSTSITHEAGHMLGLPDEYPAGVCRRLGNSDPGSLMHTPRGGDIRARHYQPFADWLSEATGRRYAAAASGRVRC